MLLPAVAATVGLGVAWSATAHGARAASSVGADLAALLNADRAAAGLAPLAWDGQLAAVGESAPYSGCGFTVDGRAADMVQRNYFAHPILGCGGQNVFAMLRGAGVPFSVAGENIGWVAGVSDPAAEASWLHRQFMASPEHRANILDPRFTAVGIGVWTTAPGVTWSGGGSAQTDVVVVAEEFAALSASQPVAQPAVATAPPQPVVHQVAAPRSQAAPTHAPAAAAPPPAPMATAPAPPRPGLPETGVAGQVGPAAAPPQTGAVALAPPVDTPAPALSAAGAGVLLGGVVARRLRLRR